MVDAIHQSVTDLSRRLQGFQHFLLGDASPGPVAALSYLRMYIPAKFEILQRQRQLRGKESRSHRRELEKLFAKETLFVKQLRETSRKTLVKTAGTFPSKHSFCKHSWSRALLADCVSHIQRRVNVPMHVAQQRKLQKPQDYFGKKYCVYCLYRHPNLIGGFQQNVAWDSSWEASLEYLVTALYEESECVNDDLAAWLACGLSHVDVAQTNPTLSRIERAQQLDTAGNFLEIMALWMLLCDGCRYDGKGLSTLALDEALWMLGFFRVASLEDGKLLDQMGYHEAMGQFHLHPKRWWHRETNLEAIYGRPSHCPLVLSHLCVRRNELIWGRPKMDAPVALASCHQDYLPSEFTPLQAYTKNSTRHCTRQQNIALLLPVGIGSVNGLQHPTGFFTWFLPALTLFQEGERTRKLLQALWRRDHIPGPPPEKLDANTEVFLVPYDSEENTYDPVGSPFKVFFKMMSPNLRSLRELHESKCYCFKAAIWGYPEASMRMHGDLDWMDAQHFRNAFRSQLLQGRFGVGDFLSKVGVRHVFSTKAVEQAFYGGLSRTSQHVGLLFAYRPLRSPTRRISNQKELVKALSELVGRMPPLHLVYLQWEELTMLDQAGTVSQRTSVRSWCFPLLCSTIKIRLFFFRKMSSSVFFSQISILKTKWIVKLGQVRLSMDFADILVQPFGAGMVWSLFLPRGSYVIELQQDADKTAHFVGCYKADISLASKGVIGIPSPWDPPTNLYSEWGAWAFKNKINFACVSNLVVACWHLFFWKLLC